MSVKDGKNAETVAQERRDHEEGIERRRWAELYHTYERCVEIAHAVWGDRLNVSQALQQNLAEEMRDRGTSDTWTDSAIPVPLFTPRDRQQFIKEAAATLLISADRRFLTVLFPKEELDAPAKPQVDETAGIEAASGADETTVEPETAVVTPS